MPAVHDELIRLTGRRMDYVQIIASLKFILKKPIYVPSIEKEQCHHLMEMAAQFELDAIFIKNLMRVLFKISRETQRKMHAYWSLNQGACVQFLLSQVKHIPMLQKSVLESKLQVIDEQSVFFCEQLISLLRFFIRFIDIQLFDLFSSLDHDFSLNYIKEQLSSWPYPLNEILLYKLFLLMNGLIKKEGYVAKLSRE